MIEILAKEGQDLDLGKRGENLARRVTFDIGGWIKTFGEGSVHLLHQRNGDKTPYPCVVEVEKTKAYWPVTNTDVAMAGRGHAELQFWIDDIVVKSITFNTRVSQSMGVAGEVPPAPAENWLNTMLGLGIETKENAEAAAESAEAAANSAMEAKTQADRAETMKDQVQEAVDGAITSAVKRVEEKVDEAEVAKQGAEDAQAAAEKARDDAQAIVGHEFVLKGGDKMLGTLEFQPDGVAGYGRIMKNANSENDYGLKMQDVDADSNYIALTLSASLQALEYEKRPAGDSEPHYAKIYDSDDPPTAEEVGALPITGGKLTSNLYIEEDYAQVNVQTADNHKATLMKNADSANDYGTILRDTNGADVAELKLNAAEKSLKYAQDGKEYRLYHQGNTHASWHSASGSDPITPPMIGAASNPNLLDNWYFADPIDQRGGYVVKPNAPYYVPNVSGVVDNTDTYYKVDSWAGTTGASNAYFYKDSTKYVVDKAYCVRGYVGAGYGIDRWKNTSNHVMTISDGSVQVIVNSTAGGVDRWVEDVYPEITQSLVGKTVTASAMIDGVQGGGFSVWIRFANESGGYIGQAIATAKSGLVTSTCLVPADTKTMQVGIRIDTANLSVGDWVAIKAAKLELGSTQTLAHQDANGNWVLNDPPPNKDLELLKCCMSTADSSDTYANNKVTPKAINAVNKAGDTMTGALRSITGDANGVGVFCGNQYGAYLYSYYGDAAKQRQLVVCNSNNTPNHNHALRFVDLETDTNATILHTGNKPSGSYTGNGDATTRTIEIGGIGGAVAIWSSNGVSIATPKGALHSTADLVWFGMDVYTYNGKLILTSTASSTNASGVTYSYQVL